MLSRSWIRTWTFLWNTCEQSFWTLNLINFIHTTLSKKETPAQVFSCEFCEIFRNTFFQRTLLVATSVFLMPEYSWWLLNQLILGEKTPLHPLSVFLALWSFIIFYFVNRALFVITAWKVIRHGFFSGPYLVRMSENTDQKKLRI